MGIFICRLLLKTIKTTIKFFLKTKIIKSFNFGFSSIKSEVKIKERNLIIFGLMLDSSFLKESF